MSHAPKTKPTPDRNPAGKFADLAIRIGARRLWSIKGPEMHSATLGKSAPSVIDAWLVASTAPAPPRVVLIHVYPGDDGIGIYSEDGVPNDWPSIEAWLRSIPPTPTSVQLMTLEPTKETP